MVRSARRRSCPRRSPFAWLGPIDEYRIIVNPILLGAGTRLFDGRRDKTGLRLVETRRFNSGALVLSYAVDGQRPRRELGQRVAEEAGTR